jgi:hypothetical protein
MKAESATRSAMGTTLPSVGEASLRMVSSRDAGEPDASGSDSGGKFTPGTILAKRYRITTLLGRGGLGEVYHADDLKLSQSVALKFLPAALTRDKAAQARFHADVIAARRIAHPNVCRVYDIGEAEGRSFLSIEYIDGEDLAVLLRRIGRLPPDKALEIARQLCAGVAAAHTAGVVHRDLKPANVMIDGRGRAHVTDFGVAGAGGLETPDSSTSLDVAWMSPEQLARGEVTIRSNLYSLGLILYEAFTGRRAFAATTREELLRRYEQSSPSLPSTLIEGIDPQVEKVIMRCLERDPAARPASALEVARVLPGGDPLAAALAAGETPSPEMVAAAGGEGALSRRSAWALLGSLIAGLIILLALSPLGTELGAAPLELSAEELEARASTLIQEFGYTDPPADMASRFRRNYAFLLHRSKRLPGPEGRRTLRDAEQSAELFLYRQSPQPLVAINLLSDVFSPVTDSIFGGDPPMETAGMVNVELDARGPLLFFRAVPPQSAIVTAQSPGNPDVIGPGLIVHAGLDAARFQPENPVWFPPEAFDATAGWVGSYAQDPATPVHVVAAAFRGKLVYFQMIGPWNYPWRDGAPAQSSTAKFASYTFTAFLFLFLVFSVVLVRFNVRHRRSDSRGALRMAAFLFAVTLFFDLTLANHVAAPVLEWAVLTKAASAALYQAAFAWLLYMALEPFVRRRGPELLIGWSRLLEGRFRDPLVGREMLIGSLAGLAVALVWVGTRALPAWFDIRGWNAADVDPVYIGSLGLFLGRMVGAQAFGVTSALQLTLLFSLMLVITRRKWPAFTLALILVVAATLKGEHWMMDAMNATICDGLVLLALTRVGVLAGAVTIYVQVILDTGPMTPSLSLWYSGRSYAILAWTLAIALYGFRIALGNRPVFAADFSGAGSGTSLSQEDSQ